MKYHIDINDYIGTPISKWFISTALKPFAGKHCDVRINSYGGDTQTALDIYRQFVDHGDVTCYIFGFTASAATILAMGAKKIKMSRYALLFIHRSSFFIDKWGQMNVEKLAETIDALAAMKNTLHTVDDLIASVYALRTGKTKDEMLAIMEEEEWLTADRCKEIGLIDEIIEDGEPPKFTAKNRAMFIANHIPLPPEDSIDKCEAQRGIKKILSDLFHCMSAPSSSTLNEIHDLCGDIEEDQEEKPAPINKPTLLNMEKLTNLAALFASLPCHDDGSVTLTATQLQILDRQLGELKSQNHELTEKVNSLLEGDGDETTHLENEGTDDNPSELANANDMFNLVKELI